MLELPVVSRQLFPQPIDAMTTTTAMAIRTDGESCPMQLFMDLEEPRGLLVSH